MWVFYGGRRRIRTFGGGMPADLQSALVGHLSIRPIGVFALLGGVAPKQLAAQKDWA